MNTETIELNKTLTKEEYKELRNNWKKYFKEKQSTAELHILYNYLRDLPLDRGFTPLKKESKINGYACNNPKWNYYQKLNNLKMKINLFYKFYEEKHPNYLNDIKEPFGELLTKERLQKFLEICQ